jgi:pimeloyl-ACP methyl ester carboxylesterase
MATGSQGMSQSLMCRLALIASAFLFAIVTPALGGDRNTRLIADPVYLKPQRLVTIDGRRRLNIYCIGRGSPTVVFDSGLGDGMMVWTFVQPVVAAKTRACAYDRAGLDFSDPSPEPRTSANIVDDLHRLLRAAHIKPPYVLVGHSLGGMNVKLYAETYLSEVAGLVFVDPTHEDMAKRSWELDPAMEAKNASYIEHLHECLKTKPSEFVAGSKLQQRCGVVSHSERLSPAILALQTERLLRPGYMRAWISEQ